MSFSIFYWLDILRFGMKIKIGSTPRSNQDYSTWVCFVGFSFSLFVKCWARFIFFCCKLIFFLLLFSVIIDFICLQDYKIEFIYPLLPLNYVEYSIDKLGTLDWAKISDLSNSIVLTCGWYLRVTIHHKYIMLGNKYGKW